CSRTFEGMVVLDGLLDPITGEIVIRELERLERELFEADWAEARQRLGDAATLADLQRRPGQRRADALRLMAERSAAKPADATEPRVLLHVLAGHDSVERMCELSNGQVVTPGEVLPLLRYADVERVIFEGPSKVIDVGVRRRLFTGATRTAVEMRDRECAHPSCGVPAERCEIDHLEPYETGGLTTQANGRCRCPFHHRWRHRRAQPST
ncbi:MAG: HNH endonuclease signature motif containing protein, partial [Acidimicrobiales bacterium]